MNNINNVTCSNDLYVVVCQMVVANMTVSLMFSSFLTTTSIIARLQMRLLQLLSKTSSRDSMTLLNLDL